MGAKIFLELDGRIQEFECKAMLSIGRIAPNDVVLPSPKVSRQHAAIRQFGDGNYYVVDTGSSNGTFLNGRRVLTPTMLTDGDTITIGASALSFRGDTAAPASKEPLSEADARSTMMTMGSMMKKITLLVADIRSFTPMSEQMPPDQLAVLLRQWCRTATEIVEKHGGTIDKFIGDAVMARWTAEGGDVAPTVTAALRVAREFGTAAERLNATEKNLPFPFKIGVGINSGQALLGNIGANINRDYTAIGDTVNVTFRLEKETKVLGKDVVIGSSCHKALPAESCRAHVRKVTVKGKEAPLDVCAFSFAELDQLLPLLPAAGK